MSTIHRERESDVGGTAYTFLKPMPTTHPAKSDSSPPQPLGDLEVASLLFPSREAASSPAVTGVALGEYRIAEQIGRGGMGAVFRAMDTRLDRVVALKVLSPELSQDRSAVQRFQNEARAAARLEHENIARVHDVGHDQSLYFIAFEFVAGTNLRDLLLSHGGPFSAEEAINYTLQIADALRQTAAADVVHRDIKPSNIIISPSGRAKLVDWGLARQNSLELSQELTQTGTTLGTFDYISPEQAVDPRNVDVRSDIYSLGCTLFHMLTGEPPYPRGSMFQKVVDHHRAEAPDPSERNPGIPSDLAKITRRMMASDPAQRYATPEAVIHDLSIVASNLGLQTPTTHGVWSSAPRDSGFARAGWGWLGAFLSLLALVWYLDRPAALPNEPVAGEQTSNDPAAQASRSNASSGPLPVGDSAESPIAPDAPADPSTPPRQTISGYSRGSQSLGLGGASSGSSLDGKGFVIGAASGGGGIASDISPARVDASSSPGSESASDAQTAAELIGGYVLRPASGGPVKRFRTLETACSEAIDGDVIELNFDRPTEGPVEPFRITGKHLTIRAARGRKPSVLLALSSATLKAGGVRTARMITLSGPDAFLEIENVELALHIPSGIATDNWNLFSLTEARGVQLNGVVVTVDNPDRKAAAIFEIASSSGGTMTRPASDPLIPAEINVENTLVRGGADLVLHQSSDDAHLSIRQSALALNGALYRRAVGAVAETIMTSRRTGNVILLENVTAVLDQGLLTVDLGDQGETTPFTIECRDSILKVAGTQTPLIQMQGHGELDKYIDILALWRGSHSFYELPSAFWKISAPRALGPIVRQWAFSEFRNLWTSEAESLTTGPLFQRSSAWTTGDYSGVGAEDFMLRTSGPNAAVGGASDRGDAGVNVTDPRFPGASRSERSDSAQRPPGNARG